MCKRLTEQPSLKALITSHCETTLERVSRIRTSPLQQRCRRRCLQDVLEPAQDHIRLYASLAHYAASKHNHLFTSPSQPLYHYPPVPPGLATAPWRGCLTLKETLPKNPLPIDYRQAITATLDDYAAHQYTMLLIDGSYHQDEIHHFGNRAGYAWSFSTSTTSLHPPQHTFTVVSTGEGSLGPHIYSSFDAELWGIYYALRQLLDDPDQVWTPPVGGPPTGPTTVIWTMHSRRQQSSSSSTYDWMVTILARTRDYLEGTTSASPSLVTSSSSGAIRRGFTHAPMDKGSRGFWTP